ARLPGSRTQRIVLGDGSERRARGTRRTAPAGDTPDRLGRPFSREIPRRDSHARALYFLSPPGGPRRLRQASAGHAGERRSHLPERSADAGVVRVLKREKGEGTREKG